MSPRNSAGRCLRAFKKQVERRYPAWFELRPFGEVLPYAHDRITVDEKSFPNASEKNPTLTILAISWRATDYPADQIKAGTL
jgi:hypothetical protein